MQRRHSLLLFGKNEPLPLVIGFGYSKYGGVAANPTLRTVTGAKRWIAGSSEFQTLVADPAGTLSTNGADAADEIGANIALMETIVARYGGGYLIDDWYAGTSTPNSSYAEGWNPYVPEDADGGQYATALETKITNGLAALNPSDYFILGAVVNLGLIDATTEINARLAGWRAYTLINRIRKHVGQPAMPVVLTLPFANGVTGYDYVAEVREALTDVASWMNNVSVRDESSDSHQAGNIHQDATGYDESGVGLANSLMALNPNTTYGFNLSQIPGILGLLEMDRGNKTTDSTGDLLTCLDASPGQIDIKASGTAAHHPPLNMDTDGAPYMSFTDTANAATSNCVLIAGRNNAPTSANVVDYVVSGADKKIWWLFVVDTDDAGVIEGRDNAATGKSYDIRMVADLEPGAAFWDQTNQSNFNGNNTVSAITDQRNVIFFEYDGSVDTDTGGVSDRIKIYVNDGASPVSVETWVSNNPNFAQIYIDSTGPLSMGQLMSSESTGVGNALSGKIFARAFGTNKLTDTERSNLIGYFTDKYVTSGYTFSYSNAHLIVPNDTLVLDLGNTDLLTKDGSDLVSAVTNNGRSANGTASGSNRPKWVADAFGSGLPGLQFFHNGSNYSQLSFADDTFMDYTSSTGFECMFQFRLTANNALAAAVSKNLTTGDQRGFTAGINASGAVNTFTSSDGTVGTSSQAAGSTVLSTGANYIGHLYCDGTNTIFSVNNITAGQSSRAVVPFNNTAPFLLGSIEGGVWPLRGYLGKVLFTTSRWSPSMVDYFGNYLADEISGTWN